MIPTYTLDPTLRVLGSVKLTSLPGVPVGTMLTLMDDSSEVVKVSDLEVYVRTGLTVTGVDPKSPDRVLGEPIVCVEIIGGRVLRRYIRVL